MAHTDNTVRRKAHRARRGNSMDDYRIYGHVIHWLPERYSHADLYRRALFPRVESVLADHSYVKPYTIVTEPMTVTHFQGHKRT